MLRTLLRVGSLVALIGSLAASSASAGMRVYVRVGPPAAIVETRPPAPAAAFVWRAGYHKWVGERYEWVPGEWVKPPYARAVWVPGRWVKERRGWYWIEGHWRRP